MAPAAAHLQLFTDVERRRFFLVPEDVVLAEGSFLITDITGRTQRRVEEAAVLAHEVDRARAHAHLASVAGGAIEAIGGELRSVARAWLEKREPPPWSEAGRRRAREAGEAARPGLALLADLTGADADTLRADSGAITSALETFGRELAELLDGSVRGGEAELEAARKKAREIEEKLRAHGLPVRDGLERWPDRLRKFVTTKDDAELARAAADRLERAGEMIERLLGAVADRIRDAADSSERPPR